MTEKRLGPPPVDGMSDVAWARVERNVFSRMDGTVTNAVASREVKPDNRRSTWVWLAVPGAAAAAFALAFFSMKGPTGSTPTEDEPSRIVASASPSSVSFGDVHVTVDANSAVVMDQKAGKPGALVEYGTAVFAVPARGDRAPFTVRAGDALIRTTNTKFRVSKNGELARVTVDAGSVEIRFRGSDVTINAAQAWSSDRPSEVSADIVIDSAPKTDTK